MIKAILFDLDGTLLPVTNDFFFRNYLNDVSTALPGVDPKLLGAAIVEVLGEVMRENDPKRTIGDVFMRKLSERVGMTVAAMTPHLDEYYAEGFPLLGRGITPNPHVPEMVSAAKDKGYRLVLATNPVFPAAATRERIRWAGLEESDFEFVTYFDDCRHTKPHLEYYRHEVLDRLDLYAADCLMVGNDIGEDMAPAAALGMSTYLLTDYLIGERDEDFWDDEGGYLELLKTIAGLPDVMV